MSWTDTISKIASGGSALIKIGFALAAGAVALVFGVLAILYISQKEQFSQAFGVLCCAPIALLAGILALVLTAWALSGIASFFKVKEK